VTAVDAVPLTQILTTLFSPAMLWFAAFGLAMLTCMPMTH
jgi:hypothetical protein